MEVGLFCQMAWSLISTVEGTEGHWGWKGQYLTSGLVAGWALLGLLFYHSVLHVVLFSEVLLSTTSPKSPVLCPELDLIPALCPGATYTSSTAFKYSSQMHSCAQGVSHKIGFAECQQPSLYPQAGSQSHFSQVTPGIVLDSFKRKPLEFQALASASRFPQHLISSRVPHISKSLLGDCRRKISSTSHK